MTRWHWWHAESEAQTLTPPPDEDSATKHKTKEKKERRKEGRSPHLIQQVLNVQRRRFLTKGCRFGGAAPLITLVIKGKGRGCLEEVLRCARSGRRRGVLRGAKSGRRRGVLRGAKSGRRSRPEGRPVEET